MRPSKVMTSDPNTGSPVPLPDSIATATSELNNLLQIISGTTLLIEDVCQGNKASQEYFTMLRASIHRAEKVTAQLVKQAGGPEERILMSPELTAAGRGKTAPSPETRKQSILVIDDEQATLGLMNRILTEAGFQVTTGQSGFECIDLFRRSPHDFDLVLLDLTMPFMDGEETFRRLREIRRDAPIIMCTGFIQHDKLHRLIGEGLIGFLRKPFAPAEIVSHIRSTLANVKYSRDGVNRSGVPAVI